MRRLPGLLGALLLAFLVSDGLHGQDKKDDKKDDKKLTGKLPTHWPKLGLTDEQKQKVYKIQSEYGDKIAALEKQVKDLKSHEKSDMEKILTEGQKTRLKEILLDKAGLDTKKDDKKDDKKKDD